MEKKLIIFDFDDTLLKTPSREDGVIIYKEKTGTDFPHMGWYGRKESLDLNIFDIKPNQEVLEKYHNHLENGDTICLVTGRIKKLENEVNEILNKYNLTFNGGIYCRDGGKDTLDFKLNLFKKMINSNLYSDIIIYEDRLEHIIEFEKVLSELNINSEINFIKK